MPTFEVIRNQSTTRPPVSTSTRERPAVDGGRLLAIAAAQPTGSPIQRALVIFALAIGTALVATTAAIHLHLWATGYRDIPTVGPLFLAQGIVGVAIAMALIGSRRLIAVVIAAGFMLASIGGLLLSVSVGLFGFMDSLAAPYAGMDLAVESAGTLVLVIAGSLLLIGHGNDDRPTHRG